MARRKENGMMIKEGIHVQEALSCLLCGVEGESFYQNLRDYLFGAPGTWDLMHCPKCQFFWLNPRPIPEDVGKLYKHYFTHNTPSLYKSTDLKSIIRNLIIAAGLGYNELAIGFLQKGVGKILCWIKLIKEMAEISVMALNGKRKGKLLDVGCGNGQFLANMRELGWEVIGVEPDAAVRVAREHLGLTVYQGTLEEIGFSSNTFDAITLKHVIEHVHDPIRTFKECRRISKPGGKIVVLTPNIKSLGYFIFRRSWRGLEVPRHLYLFSMKALKLGAERAGLKVVKLWTTARLAPLMWIISRLNSKDGKFTSGSLPTQTLGLKLEGWCFMGVEYMLCKIKDVGEELVLIATKAE